MEKPTKAALENTYKMFEMISSLLANGLFIGADAQHVHEARMNVNAFAAKTKADFEACEVMAVVPEDVNVES